MDEMLVNTRSWTTCPICGARIKGKRLDGHMRNVHPKGVRSSHERNRIIDRRRTAKSTLGWVAVVAIIVVVILVATYSWQGLDIRGNNIGDKPYNFKLRSCDGPTYSLNDELGQRPILVEFAKHDCPTCLVMCNIMNSLYQNYSSKVSFVTLISDSDATMSDVETFKQSHGSDWIFLYDKDGKVFDKYGNSFYPIFFIIGKDARIHWSNRDTPVDVNGYHIGYFTYDEMEYNLTRSF
jgi:peroxiredoxin